MKNYIIGYGSLINFESQNITGKSYWSIPVILNEFSRSWTVVYDDLQFCALGVYPDKAKSVNAVLFEIENIDLFDQREHGYSRHEVDRRLLRPWRDSDHIPEEGKVWIYLPFKEKYGKASEKYFIWQSYLDVIFMGCLSIDEKFAHEFINTTAEWDMKFLNDDRKESKYIRALKHYDSHKVDELLKLIHAKK